MEGGRGIVEHRLDVAPNVEPELCLRLPMVISGSRWLPPVADGCLRLPMVASGIWRHLIASHRLGAEFARCIGLLMGEVDEELSLP